MQFHRDGFRHGDPRIADRPLPTDVDVLVVGSGPAGLTLAAQLSVFPELRVCLAEAKPGPMQLGQADGIACRTVEMFEAFGFARDVMEEAYWVNEVVFWKPDPDDPRRIRRNDRILDVEPGLSEMPHLILNQARIHDRFLEFMANGPSRLEPHYARRLVDLDWGDDGPVTARFDTGETVRAGVVVGCDGARSQVRRSLGYELVGDAANQAWGVMDVLAVTDFPDIRYKAVIHSADEGNLLVIPREGGHLVRLYIELDELAAGQRVADTSLGLDDLIATAGRVLAPYELDVKEVAWWSIYEIGQRLCDRFDGAPDPDGVPRVFIAGDACHTHSPKAGQGMNVSVRDAFNLGWKLAAVLRGEARPELLHTYGAERRAVARELIDFDRRLAAMFSAPPKTSPDDPDGIDPAEFQAYFQQQGRFTAGVATRYEPSVITAAGPAQELATGFEVGTRFHSAPVLRVADGRPLHLGHVARADGRWRLYAFADPDRTRLERLCAAAPPGVDLRAILQGSHHDVELGDLPAALRPAVGRLGLIDYERVFVADPAGPDVFDLRGVDRAHGAAVVVRPDQHVAGVWPLDAAAEIAAFLDGFGYRSSNGAA